MKCIRSLAALYFESQSPTSDRLLLFFHSNAEDLHDICKMCQRISGYLSCGILAPEYPGFGVYNGTPSEQQILEDSDAVMKFVLEELKIDPLQIMVMGRSIGSGAAIHVASKYKVGGLVLISPFTSIKEVVKDSYGSMISSMVRERFENVNKISQVTCPIEIVHGELDKMVKVSHAYRLVGR